MTFREVTDHFGASVTRSKIRVTGNRWVTDLENDLLPCNYLFSFYFYPKGNRVTDKIETTGYREKGQKRGKTGKRASQNHASRRSGKHLLPVTRPLDGPARRVAT